jgi:hypothetical protein
MEDQNQNQPPQYQQQPYQQPQYQQPYQQGYFQPNYAQGQQRPMKPDNYLVWAILSTIFCCLPLGIVSIVYSSKVDSQYNAGDYVGAQDSANKAKNFAMWGAIIGVVGVILYILFIVVLGVAGNALDSM